MPMAYVHFVQVLVDVLCLVAPFALYPRGGSCTIFIASLVTLFFGGLLELCKSLLDPFGNRQVSNAVFNADMQVDVLITESNAALAFWPQRAEALAIHQYEKRDLAEAEKLRLQFEAEFSAEQKWNA